MEGCTSAANAVSVVQSDANGHCRGSFDRTYCRPSRRPRVANNGAETISSFRAGKLKIYSESRALRLALPAVRTQNTMNPAVRFRDVEVILAVCSGTRHESSDRRRR